MNKTILLIDDDEDDHELFQLAIADSGVDLTVAIANSCMCAFKMLEETEAMPDFIFLDLNMPQIDGRECLRALKSNSKTSHIPVVIFTTSKEQHDIDETRKLGAAGFISKPTKLNELTDAINSFLAKQLLTNKQQLT